MAVQSACSDTISRTTSTELGRTPRRHLRRDDSWRIDTSLKAQEPPTQWLQGQRPRAQPNPVRVNELPHPLFGASLVPHVQHAASLVPHVQQAASVWATRKHRALERRASFLKSCKTVSAEMGANGCGARQREAPWTNVNGTNSIIEQWRAWEFGHSRRKQQLQQQHEQQWESDKLDIFSTPDSVGAVGKDRARDDAVSFLVPQPMRRHRGTRRNKIRCVPGAHMDEAARAPDRLDSASVSKQLRNGAADTAPVPAFRLSVGGAATAPVPALRLSVHVERSEKATAATPLVCMRAAKPPRHAWSVPEGETKTMASRLETDSRDAQATVLGPGGNDVAAAGATRESTLGSTVSPKDNIWMFGGSLSPASTVPQWFDMGSSSDLDEAEDDFFPRSDPTAVTGASPDAAEVK